MKWFIQANKELDEVGDGLSCKDGLIIRGAFFILSQAVKQGENVELDDLMIK